MDVVPMSTHVASASRADAARARCAGASANFPPKNSPRGPSAMASVMPRADSTAVTSGGGLVGITASASPGSKRAHLPNEQG